ncbi:MAG: hypothetical protein JJE07_14185 [Flavobacteriaceae bacterium]|nr:hypothetical protein [Flavobacteriaceae bacterium]
MITSSISKAKIKIGEAVKGNDLRDGIFDLIKTEYPEFGNDDYISLDELNTYRRN